MNAEFMANFMGQVMGKLRDDLEFFREKKGRVPRKMLRDTKVCYKLLSSEVPCGTVNIER